MDFSANDLSVCEFFLLLLMVKYNDGRDNTTLGTSADEYVTIKI